MTTAPRFLMPLLLHTGRLSQGRVRSELRPIGAAPAQGRILSALAEHGPGIQAELVHGLSVTPGTITVMLRSMEGHGWIERVQAPAAGGARLVRLTASGGRLAQDVACAWRRADSRIQDHLPAADGRAVGPPLVRLSESLRGRAPRFKTPSQES